MMFGKLFASLFEGSMVGAGSEVFAVWAYVIAKQEPDKKVGSQVHLNPELMGFILGEDVKNVERAIQYLMAPDPKSRSKKEGGRRLVKLGEFDYQVVNGEEYRKIRDAEARREQNRVAQAKHRAGRKGGEAPLLGGAEDRKYEEAFKAGDEAECDRLAALPAERLEAKLAEAGGGG